MATPAPGAKSDDASPQPEAPTTVAAPPTDQQPAASTGEDAVPTTSAIAPPPAPAGEPTPAAAIPGEPAPAAVADLNAPITEQLRGLADGKFDRIIGSKKDRAAIDAFYSARNYAPLWITDGKVNERAKAAVAYLGQVDADGLDPSDYPVPNFASVIAIVLQTFKRCCRDKRAQLVTVLGDPGVGKTRLVTEVVRRLGPAARVVTGHCRSYGDGITFLPLADALDDLTSQIGDLREVLGSEPDAEMVTDTARALASGTSSAVDGAFPSVRRLFEAAARDAPLVVVVEDIHWAEPNLLDLLEYVVRETRARLLVICLARPELLDMRPSWGGGRLNASMVVLYPLSAEDAATLATDLGQSGDVAEIAQASGGNPLFIEHLVALARDSGIDPHTLRVPEEIQGLLSARLDQLNAADRHVVHVAAVIGMVVDAAEVAMLTGDGVEHAVEALDRLCARELFRPNPSPRRCSRLRVLARACPRGRLRAAFAEVSRRPARALSRLALDATGRAARTSGLSPRTRLLGTEGARSSD